MLQENIFWKSEKGTVILEFLKIFKIQEVFSSIYLNEVVLNYYFL